MVSCRFLICAENAVIDERTKNASIFNIIEEITPEGLPLLIPKLVIFAFLDKLPDDPDSIEAQLKMENNQKILLDKKFPINFSRHIRDRHIININAFIVEAPGKITVSLLLNSKLLGKNEILINKPRVQASIKKN